MKFQQLHLARPFLLRGAAVQHREESALYAYQQTREPAVHLYHVLLHGALDEHLQRCPAAGAINGEVVATAWLGFPVAYIFAMCCDWFVASPLAKGFAFKYLVTPGKSSPLAMTLAVSSCMVVPMVIIMSLYGACEGLTHMPGGILANLYSVPAIWMINIPHNFVMALPWNLLVAGPISRFVFRRAFPVGTVFEEEHAELLEQAMAPECE